MKTIATLLLWITTILFLCSALAALQLLLESV